MLVEIDREARWVWSLSANKALPDACGRAEATQTAQEYHCLHIISLAGVFPSILFSRYRASLLSNNLDTVTGETTVNIRSF